MPWWSAGTRKTGQRRLDVLRWGGLLPHFTKDPEHARQPINARAETLATIRHLPQRLR